MHTFVGLLVVSFASAAIASPYGSRIVGGSDAPAGKYPYQVSIWVASLGKQFHCGGSIINERYILTAAHCVYALHPSHVYVGIGNQLLNETVDFYKSEKLIGHNGFDMMSTKDDIGLIRLAEKIEYTDTVKPIALPTDDFDRDNESVMLSGWGRLYAGGPQPNSLQEIELKILGENECRKQFSVTSKQICTLTREGEGACNGDSGGPLVVDGVVIGIVSYGQPCALGIPDVFTRVYSYLDWIDEKVDLDV